MYERQMKAPQVERDGIGANSLTKLTEIENELQLLDGAISELISYHNELSGRLESVSSTPYPHDGSKTPTVPEAVLCPLANRLRAYRVEIRRVSTEIKDRLSLLQL